MSGAAAIRFAVANDIEALLAVEEAFRMAGASVWTLLDRATFERKVGAREVLVAERDGAVVGYLAFTYLWGYPWIEYARLYERHRGRGVGTELVRTLEEHLRRRGHAMLFSSTADGDDRALAWHRRVGFRDAGRLEWVWQTADELILYKQL